MSADRRRPRHRPGPPSGPVRAGYTLLETQVAFVLLGVALAGFCPLAVMQLRVARQVEGWINPGVTSYLVPQADPWARKLGAAAAIVTSNPGDGPASPGPSTPANIVTILALDPPEGDAVMVHVSTAKGRP